MASRCGERLADPFEKEHGTDGLRTVQRYLGLSLGGARSDRTTLAIIDYYRKHEKAFVVDIIEGVGADAFGSSGTSDTESSDVSLIALLKETDAELGEARERDGKKTLLAVDVPLTFPPCVSECLARCEGYHNCEREEVRWMFRQYQRFRKKHKKLKFFTPYSQRPVDLYFRYQHHGEGNLFQDDTMGANLAPQTVRMNYLKRHLDRFELIEVWPRLVIHSLQKFLKVTRKELLEYRGMERGAVLRQKILERWSEKTRIFVYERDIKKAIESIPAFDALFCAWTAMMFDREKTVKFRGDLPLESGWIVIPET